MQVVKLICSQSLDFINSPHLFRTQACSKDPLCTTFPHRSIARSSLHVSLLEDSHPIARKILFDCHRVCSSSLSSLWYCFHASLLCSLSLTSSHVFFQYQPLLRPSTFANQFIMDNPSKMAGAKSKRNAKTREAAHNPAGQAASNQGPASYDRPPDSEPRGRSDSNAGSGHARSASHTASETRAAQMEVNKALQAAQKKDEKKILSKNPDFGVDAWNLLTNVSHTLFCASRCNLVVTANLSCITGSVSCIPQPLAIASAWSRRVSVKLCFDTKPAMTCCCEFPSRYQL